MQNFSVFGFKKDGTRFYVSRARSGGMFTAHKNVRRKMAREEAERLALHLNQRHTGTYTADGRFVPPVSEGNWDFFSTVAC